MLEKLNPAAIMAPFKNTYHHAVVIPANARIVYVSGQVGLRADGSLPDTLEAQADQAWQNLMACLGEAGMGPENIVKINAYLIDADDYSAFAAARAKHIGDPRPQPCSSSSYYCPSGISRSKRSPQRRNDCYYIDLVELPK